MNRRDLASMRPRIKCADAKRQRAETAELRVRGNALAGRISPAAARSVVETGMLRDAFFGSFSEKTGPGIGQIRRAGRLEGRRYSTAPWEAVLPERPARTFRVP